MDYDLPINGVDWGYNPLFLTFDPNFQRDIQVLWIDFHVLGNHFGLPWFFFLNSSTYEFTKVRTYWSIKNWMGPNPNGPRSVSCDRAIRYSGFFGVRSGTVLLGISWNWSTARQQGNNQLPGVQIKMRLLNFQDGGQPIWAMKKGPKRLFRVSVGDDKLPSYIGIIINRYKDPY